MTKDQKINVAKVAVCFGTSMAVSFVVGRAFRNVIPMQTLTKAEQVAAGVGVYIIGGMVADVAYTHVMNSLNAIEAAIDGRATVTPDGYVQYCK